MKVFLRKERFHHLQKLKDSSQRPFNDTVVWMYVSFTHSESMYHVGQLGKLHQKDTITHHAKSNVVRNRVTGNENIIIFWFPKNLGTDTTINYVSGKYTH